MILESQTKGNQMKRMEITQHLGILFWSAIYWANQRNYDEYQSYSKDYDNYIIWC